MWGALASGHVNLMMAGLIGAFLTSLYTFRMIFIVFHGEAHTQAHEVKGLSHHLPLIVLMILSTFIGALITPPLTGVLPAMPQGEGGKVMLEVVSAIVAIAGVLLAARLYLGQRTLVNGIANSAPGRFLHVVVPCLGIRLAVPADLY